MTPYEVLGVPRSASPDEIKLAYKRKAKQWHPDKHGGSLDATARFQEIATAYDTLCDPLKRSAVDRGLNAQTDHRVFTEGYVNERAAQADVNGVCSVCNGEKVVRVKSSIFWTVDPCPKCQKPEKK